MQLYKILVAYDGTDYHGWQIQPDCLSVARVLIDKFKKVFGEEIKIHGASRTDSGVHALGQVAIFSSSLNLDPKIMLRAWNGLLPSSILIRKIQKIDSLMFNPHVNIREKIYYYHFFTKRPLPIFARYGFYYKFPIDLTKLHECLKVFIGTHDFRSFCTGYERENTVRTIYDIKIVYLKRFACYRIIVKGPKFLKYMIRRIVGACLDVSSDEKLTKENLIKSLAQKHPSQPYTTASANGLMLYAINYE